jgi:hypothetical protein
MEQSTYSGRQGSSENSQGTRVTQIRRGEQRSSMIWLYYGGPGTPQCRN